MYYQRRELLVLLVILLAFASGEQYSVAVSDEELNDNGVCHKMVTVSGNGVNDALTVRCDMLQYLLANDKLLVVGDKLFSDKADTLMVRGPAGCEQRTYRGGQLINKQDLTEDYCEDIKREMLKALMESQGTDNHASSSCSSFVEDWSFDDLDSDEVESQIEDYNDLNDWIEVDVNQESGNREATISQDNDKEDDTV